MYVKNIYYWVSSNKMNKCNTLKQNTLGLDYKSHAHMQIHIIVPYSIIATVKTVKCRQNGPFLNSQDILHKQRKAALSF